MWQWIGLAVVVVLMLVGNFVGRFAARYFLKMWARARKNEFDAGTHRSAQIASGLILAANLPLTILSILDLPSSFDEVIRKALFSVSLVGVVLLSFALWDALSDEIAERSSDRRTSRILVPIARKFVRAFIFIMAVFAAMALIFSVNVTTVIASLGIGGLVIALAAKDSVENIFGSITILFDMPFGIGDWVKVGSVDGVVEEINLRSTRIRTFEDSIITLPNSNLIKASVENLGRRRFRRLRTQLGLEYGTPPEKIDQFCVELRQLFTDHPNIRPDVIRAGLDEMAENSLNVLIYIYIEAKDFNEELEVKHGLMLEILRLAKRLEVQFAFPTRTVHLFEHAPTAVPFGSPVDEPVCTPPHAV